MGESGDAVSAGEHRETGVPWDRLAWLLVASWLGLVLLTFRDYGLTYDEHWRLDYGRKVLAWYTSGFEDDSALHAWTLVNEGAFFGFLAALADRVLPLDPYEASHLLNALFGVAAGVGVFLVARRVAGSLAGFLGALLLLLTPRFYGHSFANPGDVPFAALSILSIVFLGPWLAALPRPGWRRTWPLGLVLGAALGCRIGGLLLLAPLFLGLPVAHRLGAVRPRGGGARSAGHVLLWLVGLGALVALTALAFWPAAQVEPLRRPYRALRFATEFPQTFDVLFAGETVRNVDLPRTYLLHWLVIALPELLLLGLAVAALKGLGRLRGPRAGASAGPRLDVFLLATSAGLPVLYTVLARPAEYDGLRHYLFVVPPLCALAGIGLALALREGGRPVRLAVAAGIVLCAGLVAVDQVRLHPYQATTYFNRLVAGGLPGAVGRYETEYWGGSFKEGVGWVQEHVPPGTADDPVGVGSALFPRCTTHYLTEPGYRYTGSVDHGDFERPDVYLAPGRWNRNEAFRGEVLHTVERLGVPLLWIVRLPSGPAAGDGGEGSGGVRGAGDGR